MKKRMLGELLALNKNHWKIVGVSLEALAIFRANEYKYVKGKVIQRAHLVDRAETFEQMLSKPMLNYSQWWSFYEARDTVVLASRRENEASIGEWLDFSRFNLCRPEGLFMNKGFQWKHGEQEAGYLRELDALANVERPGS